MTAVCPECGNVAELPDSASGRRVKCHTCNAVFALNDAGETGGKTGNAKTVTGQRRATRSRRRTAGGNRAVRRPGRRYRRPLRDEAMAYDGDQDGRPSPAKVIGILAFVIVFFFLKAAIRSDGAKDGGGSDPQANIEEEAYDAAMSFVLSDLKAPSSARFQLYSSHLVRPLGDNLFRASGYVDAENSFGAKLREHWICTVQYRNGKWFLMSVIEFRR